MFAGPQFFDCEIEMKTLLFILSLILFAVVSAFSQPKAQSSPTALPDTFEAEKQLAKLAVEAHGGEKLRKMSTLFISGSVDVTASASPQSIPATFITIFAGDRYRVEINNPFQPLKQAFDGKTTISSIANGFQLPPFNRIGLIMLQRAGDSGFAITSIPDNKKKRGFRVTSPEGYVTDFYLDEKTNQIKSYNATYTVNGREVKTVVEIDRVKVVEGVVVPEKYAQRIDLEQISAYAAFTAKVIQVNAAVADDVFTSVN